VSDLSRQLRSCSTYTHTTTGGKVAVNTGKEGADRIEELEKGYEKLRIATLNAFQLMAGGQAKADLRDAYDAATEALNKQGSYDGTPETV
jgi:hypothetical protein